MFGKNRFIKMITFESKRLGTSESVSLVIELGARGRPGGALQPCVVRVQTGCLFTMSRTLSGHITIRT